MPARLFVENLYSQIFCWCSEPNFIDRLAYFSMVASITFAGELRQLLLNYQSLNCSRSMEIMYCAAYIMTLQNKCTPNGPFWVVLRPCLFTSSHAIVDVDGDGDFFWWLLAHVCLPSCRLLFEQEQCEPFLLLFLSCNHREKPIFGNSICIVIDDIRN